MMTTLMNPYRRALRLAIALVAIAGILAQPSPAGASQKSDIQRDLEGSNVILIVLNSVSAENVGCYGYDRPVTPNLDKLAAEGVRFNRAYASSASDFSSNAALLTGLDPMTTGLFGVFEIGMTLAPEFYTLAEMFADSGFRTVSFVSTLEASNALQLGQGFDFRNDYYLEAEKMPDAEVDREIMTSLFQVRSERVFVYIHLRQPDAPYDPPKPLRGKFTADGKLPFERSDPLMTSDTWGRRFTEEDAQPYRDAYDENLAYADLRLGRYLNTLRECGLYDNSIIVVTANHGEAFGQHGQIRHDRSVYEEMIRVPLVVRFPSESAPRGVAWNQVVEHIDLMPSLAEALDISVRDLRRAAAEGSGGFEGRDLGEGQSWLPLLWEGRHRNDNIAFAQTFTGPRAVIDADWKYIRNHKSGEEELYNLGEDPGETANVLAQHPDRAKELREMWEEVFDRGAQPVEPDTVKAREQRPSLSLEGRR